MSHRHTIIEPAEGLTVLTGPNNCGKSAVVTALQTLCENERGSQIFVRHGEKFARVVIETDEGSSMEWKREGSTVSYRINGRDIHRLRGGIPEDLDDILRLKPVRAAEGTEQFQVHFSEQKQPIFLLNETPGRAATFFASASDTRLLLAMQRKAQERRKDRKRDADKLDARLAQNTEQLALFFPIDSIERDLELAEQQYQRIVEQNESRRQLKGVVDQLADLQAKVADLKTKSEALASLVPLPNLVDTQTLKTLLVHHETASYRSTGFDRKLKALDHLVPCPAVEQTDGLRSCVDSWIRIDNTRVNARLRTTATAALELPAFEEPTQDLARTVRQLEGFENQIAVTNELHARFDILESPPEPTHVDGLARVVSDLGRCTTQISTARMLGIQAQNDLESAQDALKEFVREHPTCPLCGSGLSAEQVMAGGHVHG